MELGQLSLNAAEGIDEFPLIEIGDGLFDPLKKVGGERLVFLLHHVVFQRFVHHFTDTFRLHRLRLHLFKGEDGGSVNNGAVGGSFAGAIPSAYSKPESIINTFEK